MTLSGPKNQSILLRIAPTIRESHHMTKNNEYNSKQVPQFSAKDFQIFHLIDKL